MRTYFILLLLIVSINVSANVYTVNGTGNSGAGTLRAAIDNANAHAGLDTINFNLGPGGPFSIALTSALPALTDNAGVFINGWDNSGNDGTPNSISPVNTSTTTPMNASYKIILSNSNGNVNTAFTITSNNNTIQGIVLPDFGVTTLSVRDTIISVRGNSNKILGCYIGISSDGTSGNLRAEYAASVRGSNNSIGDGTTGGANIISGTNDSLNSFGGIFIFGSTSTGNTIKGNMIGLQRDGETATLNEKQRSGIWLDGASYTTIGGTSPAEANVISGNQYRGIYIGGNGTNNNLLGNVIGTKASGQAIVSGVTPAAGVYITSANNSVGGSAAGARNIISGNNTGIYIDGSTATGNTIKGNYIGIAGDGTSYLTGNGQSTGIFLTQSSLNTIGGTAAGEGNVISGNSNGTGSGITIFNSGPPAAHDETIIGNIIGPQKDGSTWLTNNQEYGIVIHGYNNTVGGNTSSYRNIISANGKYGIYLESPGGNCYSNTIKGNYIGVASNGTSAISSSSQDYGVYISGVSLNAKPRLNVIGGALTSEANVISGNDNESSAGTGVYIESTHTDGNIVKGNIIGPQKDGSTWLNNNQSKGIELNNSINNIIGGSSSADRNIISANGTYGVYVTGTSYDNIIRGNYIGLQSNGTGAIASSSQNYGIYLELSSARTIIGGSLSGEGNVISGQNNGSGSGGYGVYSESDDVHFFYGNIIGPQANGSTNVTSNAQDYGIYLEGAGEGYVIGGSTSGARNIISANLIAGIYLDVKSSIVKGNYIGIASNGSSYITSSSQDYGVYIRKSSNQVGGTAAGEGNVISGNQRGILIDNGAAQNAVEGNIIGLNAAGTGGISPVQGYGVQIQSAPNNTIGGISSAHRNIITGNSTGILIAGASSTGTIIKANYIGLNAAGTAYISSPAQVNGIMVGDALTAFNPSGVIIGGTTAGEANVISGNSNYGVFLTLYSGGTTVRGNIIGTQADGNSNVSGSSQDYGVFVSRCSNNTIGGTAGGEKNIISGNVTAGVLVSGSEASGNSINGNYIGPQSTGASIVSGSSQDYGIYLFNNTSKNTVHGNLISGNTAYGCYLTTSSVGSNTITANIIGPQKDGSSNMGSQSLGISISANRNNLIGGTSASDRNIISANTLNGIQITGSSATGNVIKGNYIGIASDGNTFITGSSQDVGIALLNSATRNTIGGSIAGEGNLISGNNNGSNASGIYVGYGAPLQAPNNIIIGNTIGPKADGSTFLNNDQVHGIYLNYGNNTIIGGTTSGHRNIISGNGTYGIYFAGSNTTGVSIKGNYIGTTSNGATAITGASQDYGIYMTGGAASNIIGGYSNTGEKNTIAHHIADGIYITGASTHFNLISRNSIHTNANKGINLNGSGNDNKAAPVITSVTMNSVTGNNASTSGVGDSVEVFKNVTGICQDAPIYVGTVKADAAGTWTLTGISVGPLETITATARTQSNNNTSELSSACAKREVTFTTLRKKLDGSYYIALNAELPFRYIEEYNSGFNVLTYKVYNDLNQVIVLENIPANNPQTVYGDNRIALSLYDNTSTPLPAGFYILEVENEKNEKQYIRFKI